MITYHCVVQDSFTDFMFYFFNFVILTRVFLSVKFLVFSFYCVLLIYTARCLYIFSVRVSFSEKPAAALTFDCGFFYLTA